MMKQRTLRIDVVGAAILAVLVWALPPESPVADAAQRRDLAGVRTLLKQGADVNTPQGDGMTALHWAAMNDDKAMAEILMYAGANLEAATRVGGYTSLHLASREGHASVVAALLEAGSDVDATTATGVRPLHLAAASGSVEAVATLLDHGADVNAIEAASGRTALMFATAPNRLGVIELLLQRGADVSIATRVVDYAARSKEDGPERRRRTKLMAAAREAQEGARATEERAQEQHQSVADASAAQLQSKEAETSEVEPNEQESETKEEEPTRQSVADASAAQLQSKEEGATKKDEPKPPSFGDLVGKQGGFTALHYAAREGEIEAARLLLDGGADVDQQTLGDRSSPLLVAAINGNYDLAMMLLDRGADPNLVSEDGAAPHFATLNN
ncbi:MAG: ankyrin repeat domain-containing protein, partial [Candidatus Binatia bacterium]